MRLNDDNLLRLPIENSRANFINGFWQWVAILAKNDYQRAAEALFCSNGKAWTCDVLRKRITTFWGGEKPWSVVIPNDRLVGVVNDGIECHFDGAGHGGWFIAQVPLTTEPHRSKDDDIPLMGVAISFFVREYRESYVLEIEIFHA